MERLRCTRGNCDESLRSAYCRFVGESSRPNTSVLTIILRAFLSTEELLSVGLTGKLTLHKLEISSTIQPDVKAGTPGSKRRLLREVWTTQLKSFAKIEKMTIKTSSEGKLLAICGLHKDKKRGHLEVGSMSNFGYLP